MKITPNFDDTEFECHCGCRTKNIHPGLAHRMQVVRDIIEESITILSGCRCDDWNEKVGGEPESYHLASDKKSGQACDWTINDKAKLKRFAVFMEDKWSGGFHFYESRGFVHCDIGSKRRWA